jgi:hypothetical protein
MKKAYFFKGVQMKPTASEVKSKGKKVRGTKIDRENGNTVYNYKGKKYIIGPSGRILGHSR